MTTFVEPTPDHELSYKAIESIIASADANFLSVEEIIPGCTASSAFNKRVRLVNATSTRCSSTGSLMVARGQAGVPPTVGALVAACAGITRSEALYYIDKLYERNMSRRPTTAVEISDMLAALMLSGAISQPQDIELRIGWFFNLVGACSDHVSLVKLYVYRNQADWLHIIQTVRSTSQRERIAVLMTNYARHAELFHQSYTHQHVQLYDVIRMFNRYRITNMHHVRTGEIFIVASIESNSGQHSMVPRAWRLTFRPRHGVGGGCVAANVTNADLLTRKLSSVVGRMRSSGTHLSATTAVFRHTPALMRILTQLAIDGVVAIGPNVYCLESTFMLALRGNITWDECIRAL